MKYSYTVLGAGMQGTAAAYFLGKYGSAKEITVIDTDYNKACHSVKKINRLLNNNKICKYMSLDVVNLSSLRNHLLKSNACLNCLPYVLNERVTQAALSAGCHLNDLGGNTDVVKRQMEHNNKALKRDISVVPDCGLAPGAINILTDYAMRFVDNPKYAKMICGGLPVDDSLPLGYKKTFSIDGLINEYKGDCIVLKNGEIKSIKALSSSESFYSVLDNKMFEISPTSGGTSLCPYEYLNKLNSYEYYTLRYPGHFNFFKGLKDTFLIDNKEVKNQLNDVFYHPGQKDCIRFFIEVSNENKKQSIGVDLYEEQDEEFTAMEKTTAFSAAIITIMQAKRLVDSGVKKLTDVNSELFEKEFIKHFPNLKISFSKNT